MNITSQQADKVLEFAKAKAKEIKIPINIAIVDEGANLKSFCRMDDALLGSVDIAIKKAKTSRLFEKNTEDLGKLSQPGEPLYLIENSNNGLITFAGGVLLRNDSGQIIGAIGVSGGSLQQDKEVAMAGANILLSDIS